MKFTPEQIFEMAREAGLETSLLKQYPDELADLARFATIAAQKAAQEEREACAKVCDAEASVDGIAQKCAAAIRARGQE